MSILRSTPKKTPLEYRCSIKISNQIKPAYFGIYIYIYKGFQPLGQIWVWLKAHVSLRKGDLLWAPYRRQRKLKTRQHSTALLVYSLYAIRLIEAWLRLLRMHTPFCNDVIKGQKVEFVRVQMSRYYQGESQRSSYSMTTNISKYKWTASNVESVLMHFLQC